MYGLCTVQLNFVNENQLFIHQRRFAVLTMNSTIVSVSSVMSWSSRASIQLRDGGVHQVRIRCAVGGQDFSIKTWGRTHDGRFGLTAWLDKHRSLKTLEMRTPTQMTRTAHLSPVMAGLTTGGVGNHKCDDLSVRARDLGK